MIIKLCDEKTCMLPSILAQQNSILKRQRSRSNISRAIWTL